MRAEVVDLLRAEAALHMPMDVDGACMSGPKGKGKMKGKVKPDEVKSKGKAKGKGKKGKETRVCNECNKPGHPRRYCQREAQHRHCFRLMDHQLTNLGIRKCTGRNAIRAGATMVESSVLFLVFFLALSITT